MHYSTPTEDARGRNLEEEIAELSRSLQLKITVAVPDWVKRCVVGAYVEAARRDGREPRLDDAVTAAIMRDAEEAGWLAAQSVGAKLHELFALDVALQLTSPLEIVSEAVAFPTCVLRRAGVPPLHRDHNVASLLPDDLYGLTPRSLGVLHPALPWVVHQWKDLQALLRARRAEMDDST
jgi:hypothetical protein